MKYQYTPGRDTSVGVMNCCFEILLSGVVKEKETNRLHPNRNREI